MSEQVSLPPVGEPSPYLPYGDNPAFSYSAESLPMLSAPESAGPGSAISPLTLSSPFAASVGQYLSIPSPSYHAGAYSPASSTFEGSIAFSDHDEYGTFDMSGLPSAGSPVFPGAPHHSSNYGVGFVPPIQTVWI
jgi:hypothetical protein